MIIAITLLPTDFHNFWHYTLYQTATGRYTCIVGPPNTICATALPCKILFVRIYNY